MLVTTLPTPDNTAANNPIPRTDTATSPQPTTQLRNIYWRKLIQVGIPSAEAKQIADAIANYDTQRQIPTYQQKQLIGHYCTSIAQARLWRLELLMGNRKF
jgi:hypothetical protein